MAASDLLTIPSAMMLLSRREGDDDRIRRPVDDPEGLVLEAWAQGFMVGTLVFMACVTVANMRRKVLLHKLILAELLLGMGHGTFIFAKEPAYGWYLSVTAIGLNVSWSLHNVIAWMKNKPFLSRRVSLFYIGTVILVQPYWVLEIYANFTYFNNINKIFERTRPWETLCRDPWWIYTTCSLFWVIKSQYDFGIIELVRHSPRFGVMLTSMCVSIVFIVVDLLSVLGVFKNALPMGINPFWKLSFVFKCLCDTVILDDFKTALDRLRDYWLMKHGVDRFTPSGAAYGGRPMGGADSTNGTMARRGAAVGASRRERGVVEAGVGRTGGGGGGSLEQRHSYEMSRRRCRPNFFDTMNNGHDDEDCCCDTITTHRTADIDTAWPPHTSSTTTTTTTTTTSTGTGTGTFDAMAYRPQQFPHSRGAWEPRKLSLSSLGVIEPLRRKDRAATAAAAPPSTVTGTAGATTTTTTAAAAAEHSSSSSSSIRIRHDHDHAPEEDDGGGAARAARAARMV